jgi:hypothetical protein
MKGLASAPRAMLAACRLTSQLPDGDTPGNVAATPQHFAFLVVAPVITEWADGWLVSRDLKISYGTRNPSPDDPGMGFLLS